MELNGVANISLILEMAKNDNLVDPFVADQIKQQLALLERYMLAYQDYADSIKSGAYGALVVGKEKPEWHEVRENPENFPTNKERFG
jgi:hypothetical protein